MKNAKIATKQWHEERTRVINSNNVFLMHRTGTDRYIYIYGHGLCSPNAMQDRKIDCTRQESKSSSPEQRFLIHLDFIIYFLLKMWK